MVRFMNQRKERIADSNSVEKIRATEIKERSHKLQNNQDWPKPPKIWQRGEWNAAV